MSKPKVIEYMTRGGYLISLRLPTKFDVCSRCEGKGTHVNPNIDGNGITAEEFAEDPEFAENYFSGLYDVRCEECDGLRVVQVVDEDRIFGKLKQAKYRAYLRQREEGERSDAEDRMTRFWENGGRYE